MAEFSQKSGIRSKLVSKTLYKNMHCYHRVGLDLDTRRRIGPTFAHAILRPFQAGHGILADLS